MAKKDVHARIPMIDVPTGVNLRTGDAITDHNHSDRIEGSNRPAVRVGNGNQSTDRVSHGCRVPAERGIDFPLID